MCLSPQSGQVPAQLVVHTLKMVRMRFADCVLGMRNDGSVGLVVIGAVLNVLGLR